MDNSNAFQKLLSGITPEEEIQLLKRGLVSEELSISGNVNLSQFGD